MSIRILLAEDHAVVRAGLKALLEKEGLTVVAEASNGREAVSLAQKLCPDVAVLDVGMPMMNGIEAAAEIIRSVPQARTVLLTVFSEDHYVLRAMRAGINGYVLKNQAAGDLIQAVREVCRGGTYVSPRICQSLVQACFEKTEVPSEPLTPRQREVLQLIAEGKSTKEVATVLEITVKTAESHRSRIMQKLEIHETATLVRYAIRRGLVQA